MATVTHGCRNTESCCRPVCCVRSLTRPRILSKKRAQFSRKRNDSNYFFARDVVLTAASVAADTFASAICTACFVAFDRLS